MADTILPFRIITSSGEQVFPNVVARPFGTLAGNTLIVTGSVAFNGYFE